jgi:hypothetical protein
MQSFRVLVTAHGIDLVLDRHQLGDELLVVSAGADITAAFIKDYNASTTPKPRPGAR